MNSTPYYVNVDDYKENFWKNDYMILLTAQGIQFIANADNEQDALDYVMDYCMEHCQGLVMTQEEQENEEFIDDYMLAGNESRYFNTFNIRICIINSNR